MPLFPPRSWHAEQADTEMSIDHEDAPHMDSHTQRIRIKNRRKRYLDLHPEYFKSSELELAGRPAFTFSSLDLVADFLT